MKLFIFVTTLLLVFCTILGKENVIYEAKGGDLFDLIRGRPPKEGALKLTRVEGDRASLPDGIYYEPPEDEALTKPEEESPYLYLNDNIKKSENDAEKPNNFVGDKKND